jgi:hypothetical protein
MLWHISIRKHLLQQSIILPEMLRKYLPKDRITNDVLRLILYWYLQSIFGFQNAINFLGTDINLIYACHSNMVLPASTFTKLKKFSTARTLTPNSTQLDNK